MRADAMSYINVGQSGPLNPLSSSGLSTRSSKAATSAPSSTDQAGTQAYRGLLSLALQTNDPALDSRVQELRQAVNDGSFQNDLPATARAIVDAALNLD